MKKILRQEKELSIDITKYIEYNSRKCKKRKEKTNMRYHQNTYKGTNEYRDIAGIGYER